MIMFSSQLASLISFADPYRLSDSVIETKLFGKATTCFIMTCFINRYVIAATKPFIIYVHVISFQNLLKHMGEEILQKVINYCLDYMSKLQLPAKR